MKSDQRCQEEFLYAAEEKKLGIRVMVFLIWALVLCLIVRVGMSYEGTIRQLMNMKIDRLVGHHQPQGKDKDPTENLSC